MERKRMEWNGMECIAVSINITKAAKETISEAY